VAGTFGLSQRQPEQAAAEQEDQGVDRAPQERVERRQQDEGGRRRPRGQHRLERARHLSPSDRLAKADERRRHVAVGRHADDEKWKRRVPAGTLAKNLGQEVVGGNADQDVERLERKRELVAEIGEQVSFEERPGFPRDLHVVT